MLEKTFILTEKKETRIGLDSCLFDSIYDNYITGKKIKLDTNNKYFIS